MGLSYEEGKKKVVYGLYLLGAVTLIEVFISLLGKGHIIPGLEEYKVLLYIVGLLLIALSLYKAYFIIYEFMHMKYEVKGLALSVLLPTTLLIWAIIAFFQEGNSWKNRRELIKEKNEVPASSGNSQTGLIYDLNKRG
jgi:cytochrome c oxidase subunit IV